MSTIERLLMSIFEKRDAVERQLSQQVDSYRHTMSCNVLAAGAVPPPWIWPSAAAQRDPKDLNREQLIADILFPLPPRTTSFVNCKTATTLPNLKPGNVIQSSSSPMKICDVNEKLYAQQNDKKSADISQNDTPKNCELLVEPEVGTCGKMGSFARVKRSRSRQRDLESRISMKSISTNLGEGSDTDKNSRRVSTSRTTTAGIEGADKYTSRSLDMQRQDLHEKEISDSQPAFSVKILSTPFSAIESSCKASQNVSVHSSSRRDGDSTSIPDGKQDFCRKSLSGTLAKYTIEDHDSGKLVNELIDVACQQSGADYMVEAAHLLSESPKNHTSSKNSVTSSGNVNCQSYSGIVSTTMETDQLMEQISCRDPTTLPVSLECGKPQDAFLTAKLMSDTQEKVTGGDENEAKLLLGGTADSLQFTNGASCNSVSATLLCTAGTEEVDIHSMRPSNKQRPELEETDVSECHSQLTASDKPLLRPSSTLESVCKNVSACSSTTRDGELNSISNAKHGFCGNGSFDRLAKYTTEDHYSGNLVNQPGDVACRPAGSEASHPLLEGIKIHSSSKETVTYLGKDAGGDIDSTVPLLEELPSRDSAAAYASLENQQLQMGDAFLTAGLQKDTEETVTSLGKDAGGDINSTVPLLEELPSRDSAAAYVSLENGQFQIEDTFLAAELQKDTEETVTSLGKDAGGDIDSTVPLLEELPSRDSAAACVSLENGQFQIEDTFLAAELQKDTEETVTSLGKDASGDIDSTVPLLEEMPSRDSAAAYVSLENGQLQIEDTFLATELQKDTAEIVTSLGKGAGGDIDSTVPLLEELPSRDLAAAACVSLENGQLSIEDTFLTTELQKDTEETVTSLGKDAGGDIDFTVPLLEESPSRDYVSFKYGQLPIEDTFLTTELQKDTEENVLGGCRKEDNLILAEISDMGASFGKGENQGIVAPIIDEAQEESSVGLAGVNPSARLKDETEIVDCSILKLKAACDFGLGQDYLHDEDTVENANLDSFYPDEEFSEMVMCDADKSTRASSHFDNALLDRDVIMPEFEGFNIGVPLLKEGEVFCNDPDFTRLTEERASMLEELRGYRGIFTPEPYTSTQNRISEVPEVDQSLSSGSLARMNLTSTCRDSDAHMKQFSASEGGILSGLCCNLGSKFDGSFPEKSFVHSEPSSSAISAWGGRKLPLTPPVGKFSQIMTPVRVRTSSGEVGFNPELTCFRIDENACTIDELNASGKMTSLTGMKDSDERTALADVCAEYQNSPNLASVSKDLEKSRSESVRTKRFGGTRAGSSSSFGKGASKSKSKIHKKENALSVSAKRGQNAVDCNRSYKPEQNSRNRMDHVKGCKPNNIVSNMSSFIPLVRQKQEATAPTKGKNITKVKALEAAEAAKCLEERKQEEREKRKAAIKLERERLEQEKIRRLELEDRKTKEEKRKKETDIASRRRQREEGKKEEARKKRRTEITRTLKRQRDQEERLHFEKEKKLRQQSSGGRDGKKNEPRKAAQPQLKLGKDNTGCRIATGSELITNEVVAEDARHGYGGSADKYAHTRASYDEEVARKSYSSQETIRDECSGYADFRSYEMSPYVDSDNEDGEEENKRKGKYIPPWARRENLHQTILSNQGLDPVVIFARKRSFSLTEVLGS